MIICCCVFDTCWVNWNRSVWRNLSLFCFLNFRNNINQCNILNVGIIDNNNNSLLSLSSLSNNLISGWQCAFCFLDLFDFVNFDSFFNKMNDILYMWSLNFLRGQDNNWLWLGFYWDDFSFCFLLNIIDCHFLCLFVVVHTNSDCLFCLWINSSNLISVCSLIAHNFKPYWIFSDNWNLLWDLLDHSRNVSIFFLNFFKFIGNQNNFTLLCNILFEYYFFNNFRKNSFFSNYCLLSLLIYFSDYSFLLLSLLVFIDHSHNLDAALLLNFSCDWSLVFINWLAFDYSLSYFLEILIDFHNLVESCLRNCSGWKNW